MVDLLKMGVQASSITDYSVAANSPAVQLFVSTNCMDLSTSGVRDTVPGTSIRFEAPDPGSSDCNLDGTTPMFTVGGIVSNGISFNDQI